MSCHQLNCSSTEDQLLTCRGCQNSFHPACLNVSDVPIGPLCVPCTPTTPVAPLASPHLNDTLLEILSRLTTQAVAEPLILPEFGGEDHEDPATFVQVCEQRFQQHQVRLDRYAELAKAQLRGAAAAWRRTSCSIETTWLAFKDDLIQEYANPQRIRGLKQKLYGQEQKTGEDALQFLNRKRGLMRRLEPHADELSTLRSLAVLLKPDLRILASLIRTESVDKFVRTVRDLEQRLPETTQQPPIYNFYATTSSVAPRTPPSSTEDDLPGGLEEWHRTSPPATSPTQPSPTEYDIPGGLEELIRETPPNSASTHSSSRPAEITPPPTPAPFPDSPASQRVIRSAKDAPPSPPQLSSPDGPTTPALPHCSYRPAKITPPPTPAPFPDSPASQRVIRSARDAPPSPPPQPSPDEPAALPNRPYRPAKRTPPPTSAPSPESPTAQRATRSTKDAPPSPPQTRSPDEPPISPAIAMYKRKTELPITSPYRSFRPSPSPQKRAAPLSRVNTANLSLAPNHAQHSSPSQTLLSHRAAPTQEYRRPRGRPPPRPPDGNRKPVGW